VAIRVGGTNGGRRSRGVPPLAEINVTPFVDVALVLLIIFMITAHAMDSGIEVNVPKTKTVATSTKDLPIITITKDGEVYLGNNPVDINNLESAIHTKYPGQTAVYVKADAATPWDPIANVSSVLGDAKLNVSFVTRPSGQPGAPRRR
jgi:biopolymer transport protein ExbD